MLDVWRGGTPGQGVLEEGYHGPLSAVQHQRARPVGVQIPEGWETTGEVWLRCRGAAGFSQGGSDRQCRAPALLDTRASATSEGTPPFLPPEAPPELPPPFPKAGPPRQPSAEAHARAQQELKAIASRRSASSTSAVPIVSVSAREQAGRAPVGEAREPPPRGESHQAARDATSSQAGWARPDPIRYDESCDLPFEVCAKLSQLLAGMVSPDKLYAYLINEGGGDCFYRALSQLTTSKEDSHEALRARAAARLQGCANPWPGFVTEAEFTKHKADCATPGCYIDYTIVNFLAQQQGVVIGMFIWVPAKDKDGAAAEGGDFMWLRSDDQQLGAATASLEGVSFLLVFMQPVGAPVGHWTAPQPLGPAARSQLAVAAWGHCPPASGRGAPFSKAGPRRLLSAAAQARAQQELGVSRVAVREGPAWARPSPSDFPAAGRFRAKGGCRLS